MYIEREGLLLLEGNPGAILSLSLHKRRISWMYVLISSVQLICSRYFVTSCHRTLLSLGFLGGRGEQILSSWYRT